MQKMQSIKRDLQESKQKVYQSLKSFERKCPTFMSQRLTNYINDKRQKYLDLFFSGTLNHAFNKFTKIIESLQNQANSQQQSHLKLKKQLKLYQTMVNTSHQQIKKYKSNIQFLQVSNKQLTAKYEQKQEMNKKITDDLNKLTISSQYNTLTICQLNNQLKQLTLRCQQKTRQIQMAKDQINKSQIKLKEQKQKKKRVIRNYDDFQSKNQNQQSKVNFKLNSFDNSILQNIQLSIQSLKPQLDKQVISKWISINDRQDLRFRLANILDFVIKNRSQMEHGLKQTKEAKEKLKIFQKHCDSMFQEQVKIQQNFKQKLDKLKTQLPNSKN